MERSIILSDTLANRLKHYLQEHPNERVSDLIEEILQQKEKLQWSNLSRFTNSASQNWEWIF